ncbi:conserved hypothetical protein [Candidatus Desulfarcum epimagneticum]|uniref:Tetratricopeptide repeat protein n=1 Tax=uncultured Desulfobacteraceae bacterium TaxID=218296 RepID=A0A484HHA0_9BACT|nr:conserved hypothetical protein [uncultured Desulfobacteraceae bacterium]
MNPPSDFETLTMAKIHADQGRLGKAADICRNLLNQAPDQNQDQDQERRGKILKILSDLENRVAEKGRRDAGRLAPLFEKWLGLVLARERLARLQKIKTDMAPSLPLSKNGV